MLYDGLAPKRWISCVSFAPLPICSRCCVCSSSRFWSSPSWTGGTAWHLLSSCWPASATASTGWLRALTQQYTRLGLYLDPIADKLLLSTLFLVLTHMNLVPRYVTVLVFSRDLGILLIATLLFATGTLRDFRPSLLGKFNTLVQIFGLTVVLVEQVWPSLDVVLLRVVAAALHRLARAHLRRAVCLDRRAQSERSRAASRGIKRSPLP